MCNKWKYLLKTIKILYFVCWLLENYVFLSSRLKHLVQQVMRYKAGTAAVTGYYLILVAHKVI